jgi:hypothetical protein
MELNFLENIPKIMKLHRNSDVIDIMIIPIFYRLLYQKPLVLTTWVEWMMTWNPAKIGR